MSGKISVVINTYNASEHLGKVLESLNRFDEIVVCDIYIADERVDFRQLIKVLAETFHVLSLPLRLLPMTSSAVT